MGLFVSASVWAQPHLASPSPKFDFGIVPSNSILRHQFWLKSTGTDTVKINEIKTGCSCVVSDLNSKSIAPGDSLQIGFTWNTKRMRGTVYRSPRLFYKGVSDPLILQMSAGLFDYPDSARPVSLKPYRLEFGRTKSIDIDSIGITLTNHSGDDLSVQVISGPGEKVTLEMPTSVPANGTATGFARLNPGYRDSEFQVSATLLFGDRDATHLTIPIQRKFY